MYDTFFVVGMIATSCAEMEYYFLIVNVYFSTVDFCGSCALGMQPQVQQAASLPVVMYKDVCNSRSEFSISGFFTNSQSAVNFLRQNRYRRLHRTLEFTT